MFDRGVRLFSFFGFKARNDWSWLFLALLLSRSVARGVFPFYDRGLSTSTYWLMGIIGALGLFVWIILHELGHTRTSLFRYSRSADLPGPGQTQVGNESSQAGLPLGDIRTTRRYFHTLEAGPMPEGDLGGAKTGPALGAAL